jgi:hypothetical protein
MDDRMEWAYRVKQIVEMSPAPYKDRQHLAPRPPSPSLQDGHEVDAQEQPPKKRRRLETKHANEPTTAKQAQDRQRLAPSPRTSYIQNEVDAQGRPQKKRHLRDAGQPQDKQPQSQTRRSGKEEYSEAVRYAHRRFFYSFMEECAERRQGLLLELARNGGGGDFAYCKYRWSRSEQLAFREFSHVPAFAHTLSPLTPIVCIYYYCRHRECWYTGPKLTDFQFRRLDSSSHPRIIVSDISGPDTSRLGDINDRPALAIIPSEDLQPTISQRTRISVNREATKMSQADWEKHMPALSHFLNKGKFLSQYCLPNLPLTGGCSWKTIWEFLDGLAACETQDFQHPLGITREAAPYRYTLQQYNQQLADDLKMILESRDKGAKDILGDPESEDEPEKT